VFPLDDSAVSVKRGRFAGSTGPGGEHNPRRRTHASGRSSSQGAGLSLDAECGVAPCGHLVSSRHTPGSKTPGEPSPMPIKGLVRVRTLIDIGVNPAPWLVSPGLAIYNFSLNLIGLISFTCIYA